MWSEGSCGITCQLIIFTLTKISKLNENMMVGLSGQAPFVLFSCTPLIFK